MKTHIFLLAMLFFAFACEKNENNGDPRIPEKKGEPSEPQAIIDSLTYAYNSNSTDLLKSVLDKWNLENLPVLTSSLTNDTIKNLYEIYKEFYTPFNIGRLGDHEWGSDLYEGMEYIIIQDKLHYGFNFNNANNPLNTGEISDSITNFRPDVQFAGVKNLYLTINYRIALNGFLGSEYFPFGTYGIMSPAVPDEESWDRMVFLGNYIRVYHGHWGGYWHLETHPQIFSIQFNEDMDKASCNFRVVYMFGSALFKKKSGKWTMISSSITGIE